MAVRINAAIKECVGTACLVYFGCGAACAWGSAEGLSQLAIACTFGSVAAVLGEFLEGQHNCSVTMYLALCGRLAFPQALLNIGAQCAGAVLGALALLLSEDRTGTLASTQLKGFQGGGRIEILRTGSALLAEALCTCALCLVAETPWALGVTVSTSHILLVRATGCSLNPARSLGPALVTWIMLGQGEPSRHLWLCVAPLSGGLLAAAIKKYQRGAARREIQATGRGEERVSPF